MFAQTSFCVTCFLLFHSQGPRVLSVRSVRLTRECWTSIVSWDALKWLKWTAFPKTSSSWDAAYEESPCSSKRQREQVNVAETCLLPSWEKLPWWFYTTLPSGRAPGDLFLGFVYRSTAVAHKFPCAALGCWIQQKRSQKVEAWSVVSWFEPT